MSEKRSTVTVSSGYITVDKPTHSGSQSAGQRQMDLRHKLVHDRYAGLYDQLQEEGSKHVSGVSRTRFRPQGKIKYDVSAPKR